MLEMLLSGSDALDSNTPSNETKTVTGKPDWKEYLLQEVSSPEPVISLQTLKKVLDAPIVGPLPAVADNSTLEIVTALDMLDINPSVLDKARASGSLQRYLLLEEPYLQLNSTLHKVKSRLCLYTDTDLTQSEKIPFSTLLLKLSSEKNLMPSLLAKTTRSRMVIYTLCEVMAKNPVSGEVVGKVFSNGEAYAITLALQSGNHDLAIKLIGNEHSATLHYLEVYRAFLAAAVRSLPQDLKDETEEVVSMAFTRIYKKVASDPYMTTILFDRMILNSIRTIRIDLYRKSKQELDSSALDTAYTPDIDSKLSENEYIEALLSHLEGEQAEVMYTSIVLGLKPQEILDSPLSLKWNWKTIADVYRTKRNAIEILRRAFNSDGTRRHQSTIKYLETKEQPEEVIEYIPFYSRVATAEDILDIPLLPANLQKVDSITRGDFARRYPKRHQIFTRLDKVDRLPLTEEERKSFILLLKILNKVSDLESSGEALKGLIISATQAGRDECVRGLIAESTRRTLVVVSDLMQVQPDHTEYGVINQYRKEYKQGQITYITQESLVLQLGLSKRSKKTVFNPEDYEIVIVQEASNLDTKTGRVAMQCFPNATIIGVTSELDPDTQRRVSQIFPQVIDTITVSEAVRNGYLCPVISTVLQTEVDIQSVYCDAEGDFVLKQLEESVNVRNRNILAVDIANRFPSQKIVIRCVNEFHSRTVRQLLSSYNIDMSRVIIYSRIKEEKIIIPKDASIFLNLCPNLKTKSAVRQSLLVMQRDVDSPFKFAQVIEVLDKYAIQRRPVLFSQFALTEQLQSSYLRNSHTNPISSTVEIHPADINSQVKIYNTPNQIAELLKKLDREQRAALPPPNWVVLDKLMDELELQKRTLTRLIEEFSKKNTINDHRGIYLSSNRLATYASPQLEAAIREHTQRVTQSSSSSEMPGWLLMSDLLRKYQIEYRDFKTLFEKFCNERGILPQDSILPLKVSGGKRMVRPHYSPEVDVFLGEVLATHLQKLGRVWHSATGFRDTLRNEGRLVLGKDLILKMVVTFSGNGTDTEHLRGEQFDDYIANQIRAEADARRAIPELKDTQITTRRLYEEVGARLGIDYTNALRRIQKNDQAKQLVEANRFHARTKNRVITAVPQELILEISQIL